MSEPDKFCVNCENYQETRDTNYHAVRKCKVLTLDPVTGNYGEPSCDVSRFSPYLCGNDAKFYEPKVST